MTSKQSKRKRSGAGAVVSSRGMSTSSFMSAFARENTGGAEEVLGKEYYALSAFYRYLEFRSGSNPTFLPRTLSYRTTHRCRLPVDPSSCSAEVRTIHELLSTSKPGAPASPAKLLTIHLNNCSHYAFGDSVPVSVGVYEQIATQTRQGGMPYHLLEAFWVSVPAGKTNPDSTSLTFEMDFSKYERPTSRRNVSVVFKVYDSDAENDVRNFPAEGYKLAKPVQQKRLMLSRHSMLRAMCTFHPRPQALAIAERAVAQSSATSLSSLSSVRGDVCAQPWKRPLFTSQLPLQIASRSALQAGGSYDTVMDAVVGGEEDMQRHRPHAGQGVDAVFPRGAIGIQIVHLRVDPLRPFRRKGRRGHWNAEHIRRNAKAEAGFGENRAQLWIRDDGLAQIGPRQIEGFGGGMQHY